MHQDNVNKDDDVDDWEKEANAGIEHLEESTRLIREDLKHKMESTARGVADHIDVTADRVSQELIDTADAIAGHAHATVQAVHDGAIDTARHVTGAVEDSVIVAQQAILDHQRRFFGRVRQGINKWTDGLEETRNNWNKEWEEKQEKRRREREEVEVEARRWREERAERWRDMEARRNSAAAALASSSLAASSTPATATTTTTIPTKFDSADKKTKALINKDMKDNDDEEEVKLAAATFVESKKLEEAKARQRARDSKAATVVSSSSNKGKSVSFAANDHTEINRKQLEAEYNKAQAQKLKDRLTKEKAIATASSNEEDDIEDVEVEINKTSYAGKIKNFFTAIYGKKNESTGQFNYDAEQARKVADAHDALKNGNLVPKKLTSTVAAAPIKYEDDQRAKISNAAAVVAY